MSDLQFILAVIPSIVTLGLIGWLSHVFGQLDQLRRENTKLRVHMRETRSTAVEMAHWVVKAGDRGMRVDCVTLERARYLIEKV